MSVPKTALRHRLGSWLHLARASAPSLLRALAPALFRRGLFVLPVLLAMACNGGELEYVPPKPGKVKTAFDDLPGAHERRIAPEGFKTTEQQTADWHEKAKKGEPFNDLQLRAGVTFTKPEQEAAAIVEPGKVRFPAKGNEDLLKLQPGAPLVGHPAVPGTTVGKGNNLLGYLRKVKSVQEVDGEVVVETEPAQLTDVIVGGAKLEFPQVFQPLPITDEMVDIRTILTDLPARLTPTDTGVKVGELTEDSEFGQKQGALEQEVKLGVGQSFTALVNVDLQQLLIDLKSNPLAKFVSDSAGIDFKLAATGKVKAKASLKFGVFMELIVEETWSNPLPHLKYFYAGAGGVAEIKNEFWFDITLVFSNGTDPKKVDAAQRWMVDNPQLWGPFEYEIGEAKYFDGPVLPYVNIPTVFRFAPQLKCSAFIDGSLSAKGKTDIGFDGAYAIEFWDGQWGTKKPDGFSKDFQWETKNVAGGAQIKCEIGPRLDWLIAGVAGPTVTVRLGANGFANYEPVCPHPGKIAAPQKADGKINAGFDIGLLAFVGVTIDLAKLVQFNYDAKVLEKWWPVWRDSFPVSPGFGICPSSCNDGVQNDFETGVDCGGFSKGAACNTCDFGQKCVSNDDCKGTLMCSGGTCGNLNCQTGKKEDYMTDVNCGGLCASAGFTCESGKKCDKNSDCASGTCDWGKCGTPQCNNKQKDWWETDVDCGGTWCPKCNGGLMCKNDTDCLVGKCQLFNQLKDIGGSGLCIHATCNADLYFQSPWGKKGDMTDEMCGGHCARTLQQVNPLACHYGKDGLLADLTCGADVFKCADGKKCVEGGDCRSGTCLDGICTTLLCKDGTRQGYESDVDCGGLCPKKCGLDQACTKDGDCVPGLVCNEASVGGGKFCAPCVKNGKADGYESDVDCGSQCTTNKTKLGLCSLGQKCFSNADCATGYTTTFQGQQVFVDAVQCSGGTCKLTCFNGYHDQGSEADVDCGGKCAKKCAQGQVCKSGGDCEAGACLAGKCASKCQNAKKDDGEGGPDCGGNCPNKCLKGMQCTLDGDCTTGQCLKGVCGVDACKDNVLSAGEGDVDCGGNCDATCATGKGCKADKDCQSGFCDGKACVATGCEDKKQTTGETDVDCGGSCSPGLTCALSQKCKQGGDCQTAICSKLGKCVGSKCLDGLKTGGETDVDCGGVCSAKCTTGQGCQSGADCDSKYCDGTVCVGDFCSDKVLSSGESDVDCGGPCTKKCLTGKACKGGGDCASGVCSVSGVCASGACEDGKKSVGEADIDCGGKCQTPCLVGSGCNGGIDCASGLCAAVSLACVATTCQDEITDAGETDVDCGGGCKKCAISKGCAIHSDCQSGWCDGKKCVATACEDKVQDEGETAVDCGGPCEAKCATDKGCATDGDCQSGYCDAKGKLCVAGPCQDNHLDKGETDVDCGGICQANKTCGLGQGCTQGTDCGSSICSLTGQCVASTCEDGKATADETGVDCGGACPQKCTAGQGCKAGTDCDSGFCSAKSLCVGGACEDGKLSAGETDVDCGGPCDGKCAIDKGCKVEKDCDSGFCDGTVCVASACLDKKADVGETDVDCGGPCTAKCSIDKGCGKDGDCQTGVCAVKTLKCVASTCQSEAKDGAETDVDCGGSCSAKCASGKGCKANADCQSGFCDGQKCVDDPCLDQQKDEGESDVDCGNVCSAKCLVGQGCSLPSDCSSTFCDGKACVATACEDKKQDFGETDVDCGGSCLKCGADMGCGTGDDCLSGLCAVVSAVCVTTTCADEVKSGDETDVDCGGGCGQKCVTGKGCSKDGDCASGYCDGQVCVADHCLDKKKDVGETGVDCGGTCQTACDNGQGCELSSDCTSTFCAAVSLACVPTPCLDEAKNGAETDVDCGGAVCSGKCATGKGCKAGGDCASGFCNTTTGKCVASSCEDGVKSGSEVGPDCGGDCEAKCKDGDACGKDDDCASGTCNAPVNGQAKVCGCPIPTKYMELTIGGVKKARCVPNYFSYGESSCSSVNGNLLQCNNYGYQITQLYGGSSGWKHSDAVKYCDNLEFAGFDDYFLPTLPMVLNLFQFKEQQFCSPSKPVSSVMMYGNTLNPPGAIWTSTTATPKENQYLSWQSGPVYKGSPYVIDTWAWNMIRATGWPDNASPMPIGGPYGDVRSMYFYCARWPYDAPTLPVPRYKLIDSGLVVQDMWNGRQWYRNRGYKLQNWKQAIDYCASINVGGKTGWRLPTMNELLQTIDLNKAFPYWDTDFFPVTDGPGPPLTASETLFTSSPLCNNSNPETGSGCPYMLSPHDLVTISGTTTSALCVKW